MHGPGVKIRVTIALAVWPEPFYPLPQALFSFSCWMAFLRFSFFFYNYLFFSPFETLADLFIISLRLPGSACCIYKVTLSLLALLTLTPLDALKLQEKIYYPFLLSFVCFFFSFNSPFVLILSDWAPDQLIIQLIIENAFNN